MTEITLRIYQIANPLFEHLSFWETPIDFALPHLHPVASDAKGTARGRLQTDPSQVIAKAAEQLLCQPGRTQ